MSVRASLEEGTVAVASFHRKQRLLDVREYGTKLSSDDARGIDGSDFRRSMEEHFAPADSDTEPQGQDEESLSISQSLRPSTQDGTEARKRVRSSAAGNAKLHGTAPNQLGKSSRSKVLSLAILQKQFSNCRVFSADSINSCKSSVQLQSSESNLTGNDAAGSSLVLLNSLPPITATNENGPIRVAIVISSDLFGDESNVSKSSIAELSANVSPIRSEDSQMSIERNLMPHGLPGANSKTPFAPGESDSRAERNDGANTRFPESFMEHAHTVQVSTPASARSSSGTGLQMKATEMRYDASEMMNVSGGDQQSGLGRAALKRHSVIAASQPSTGRAESGARSVTLSEDANGGFKQLPSNIAEVEPVRDWSGSLDPKASLQPAGSNDAVKTIKVSKLASRRAESNDARSRNTRSMLPNAPDVFSLRAVDFARTTEVTNAGSTAQKKVDVMSSDTRLADTFAALEPGSRHDTGALNWTRTGHLQAEAGFQDPALGWIGVKAETIGGVVHATLSPQSSEAAKALSGHIPDLHSYLSASHTPVETLTLVPFGGSAHDFTGQQSGQSGGQSTGQDQDHNSVPAPALQIHSNARHAPQETASAEEVFTPSNSGISSGNGHISVLA